MNLCSKIRLRVTVWSVQEATYFFFLVKCLDLAYKRSQYVTFWDFPALGIGSYFSWQCSHLKAVYLTLLSGFSLIQNEAKLYPRTLLSSRSWTHKLTFCPGHQPFWMRKPQVQPFVVFRVKNRSVYSASNNERFAHPSEVRTEGPSH